MRAVRARLAASLAGSAEGADRLRQDALRRPHGGAAGAAAPHRRLPRRSDRRRSHRPLPAEGRRDRVDRRSADARGAGRRHLLSRRSRGGAQGRHRRAASAHRRSPHPAAGADRRGACGARQLHARGLLQSRLPDAAESAEALDAAALRRHRVRLPAAGAGGCGGRGRKRAGARLRAAASRAGRSAARAERA